MSEASVAQNADRDPPEIVRLETRLREATSSTLFDVLGKSVPLPSVLYHYTDEKGLLGVLRQGEIWATHQEFLNDPSETEYAQAIALALVKQTYPNQGDFRDTLSQAAGESCAVWHGEYHADAYVASFSEERDLLSQWRAYANNGRGYCIGIRPDATLHGQRLTSFDSSTAFLKVTYGEQELTSRLREFLIQGQQIVEHAEEEGVNRGRALNRLAWWLQLVVQLSRRVSKSQGYREEREWRLVHVRRRAHPYSIAETEGISFRTSRGQVIPYLPISLKSAQGRTEIESVLMGPAATEPERELALRMLLRSCGCEDRFQRSGTQYR